MTLRPNEVVDGALSAEGGVDSGNAPSIIGPNQVSFAVNATMRGGFWKTRPSWFSRELTYESGTTETNFALGSYQGACFYSSPTQGTPGIILAKGGRLYHLVISSSGTEVRDISAPADLNGDKDFAYLWQGENFVFVVQGTYLPLIFDGLTTRRSLGSPGGELPPAYVGAYVNGRNWIARPDRRSYLGSDLVGASSGTLPYDFLDAIYKVTENTLLSTGGDFKVPLEAGLITGIGTTVLLDTSLGQGPLSIFTTNQIFTNQAPADATLWQNLTWPVQTVAQVEYGAVGPRSIVNVNSDAWYRSFPGIQSFIQGRRNFNQGWGNATMSHEMLRVLDYDSPTLLDWCSSVLFDNRLLVTCSPRLTDTGVVWDGLAVINFDGISSMYRKSNPAWEGLWTGLPVYQLVKGIIDGKERCWALVAGPDGLDLWELMPGQGDTRITGDPETVTIKRIESFIESRSFIFGNAFQWKRLDYLEWFVDQLSGSVDFDIRFRPDQYPSWVEWVAMTQCNTVTKCDEGCNVTLNYQPGYRPYLTTPTAPATCLNERPANLGYEFQVRLQWTGQVRIKQMRVHADLTPGEVFTQPCAEFPCQTVDVCAPGVFSYSSYS